MKRQIGVKVVVVLLTISEGALKTLLIRHDKQRWMLPSDTYSYNEPLEVAAQRAIGQQVGVKVDYLEQLYTFDYAPPSNSERCIEVAYYGLIPSALLKSEQLADRMTVKWFSEQEQPRLLEDHARIVQVSRERLRGKLSYTAVGFELLPAKFSLAELQNLYEIIIGKVLDKRNFRKKIMELGILEPTGEERNPERGRGRPASLYRFKPEVFRQLETKGDIFPF